MKNQEPLKQLKMVQTGRVLSCCLLVTLFDLSTVALMDRRLTLATLLDNIEDNSIIIIGKCFKSIAVLADVTFRFAANLFRKGNQPLSADASKLRMNGVTIVYKDDGSSLWVDPYVGNLIKNVCFSKLDVCIKRLTFTDFNISGVALKRGQFEVVDETETLQKGFLNVLRCTGSAVLKNIGQVLRIGGGHTLPVYFEQELDENRETTLTTYVVCDKESNYDKPSTPDYGTNSHDGMNIVTDTPEKRTRYTFFKECSTRLATFCHCDFFTDHQTLAHLGFFYKGKVTISDTEVILLEAWYRHSVEFQTPYWSTENISVWYYDCKDLCCTF